MHALDPLVWINVVGLTPRLLEFAPNLKALGALGSSGPLKGVLPAVTCSAQASALTGLTPSGHGIVGNGWFHRDTGEVRFWLQSNKLIQGETVYAAAKRLALSRGQKFTAAKMFWWFNQGAPVDWSVTPKPWYGSDGSKVFGVHSEPASLAPVLERKLGKFPFFSFWGPRAGLPSSEWIARATVAVMREQQPTFTMVYLPHLDYDLQRFGPDTENTPKLVSEVDRCAGLVIDQARQQGARIVVFSEYGLMSVERVEYPNRALREAGLLAVRDGPFGEQLDTFRSRAFAVCDHQLAHVYVRDSHDLEPVAALLESLPGVARVLDRSARVSLGMEHPRCGDLALMSAKDSWFAYPYWLDDKRAPDYARTVDIQRKPGYDPLELLTDPKLKLPALRVARRILQKKLGMRYRMDVIPLETGLIGGSHGLLPIDPRDGAVFVSDDPEGADSVGGLVDLKEHALRQMGLLL